MANLHRYVIENHAYHTISTTYLRRRLFEDSELAEIVASALIHVSLTKANVHAYVLMPDHLHLVISPKPPHTLPQVMQSLKGYTARQINQARGMRGRVWQQSYYERVIRDEEHLAEAIQYVEWNPVMAKLAAEPGDYRFSSAWRGEGSTPRLESLGYVE